MSLGELMNFALIKFSNGAYMPPTRIRWGHQSTKYLGHGWLRIVFVLCLLLNMTKLKGDNQNKPMNVSCPWIINIGKKKKKNIGEWFITRFFF